jgi:hypothetical protein
MTSSFHGGDSEDGCLPVCSTVYTALQPRSQPSSKYFVVRRIQKIGTLGFTVKQAVCTSNPLFYGTKITEVTSFLVHRLDVRQEVIQKSFLEERDRYKKKVDTRDVSSRGKR